jgi:hypothetical protein
VFVCTDTEKGIFEITKLKVTEYQDYANDIRILDVKDTGIIFIGI